MHNCLNMKKVGVAIITALLLFSSISLLSVAAQECFLPCTVNEDCGVDQSCDNGCCVANDCVTDCTTNYDCTLDHTCGTDPFNPERQCCIPVQCSETSDCPGACTVPEGFATTSIFFPLQCNLCQNGFCLDPPSPCPGSTLCTAGCTGNNPICGGTCCVGCSPSGTNNNNCPDDGDPCTDRVCAQSGACSNPPKDCDDNDKCTIDGCSAGTCTHTPVTCQTCQSCNPQNGNCQNNNDLSCTDGDPCTDDACMAGECQSDPINCDDGNDCNGIETCSGGQCQSGTPVNCDDQDPCTDDSCNPNNGNCQNQKIQGCCVTNDDCMKCEQCVSNQCESCTTDIDHDGFISCTPVIPE